MSAAWRDLAGFQQELQRGLIENTTRKLRRLGPRLIYKYTA
jgi:hypothetical protein